MPGMMKMQKSLFEQTFSRRAAAILGCAVLIFFTAGGTFLHHHQGGPNTACHICQTLHMPALAAASPHLNHTLAPLTWYFSLPLREVPQDSFALHRASRAPPSA
jgi:hypothetical protein